MKYDKKGQYFLIGVASCLVVVYWLFSGHFFSLSEYVLRMASKETAQSGYQGTVSILFPMAVQFVLVVGLAAAFAMSAAWAGIWDLLTGFHTAARVYVEEKKPKKEAMPERPPQRTVNVGKLVEAIERIDARLNEVHTKVFPPPPSEAELLREALAKKEKELMQAKERLGTPAT